MPAYVSVVDLVNSYKELNVLMDVFQDYTVM